MILTFLIRSKDSKEYSGFFLNLLLQCELQFFEGFLHFILTEIDEFLWGGVANNHLILRKPIRNRRQSDHGCARAPVPGRQISYLKQ